MLFLDTEVGCWERQTIENLPSTRLGDPCGEQWSLVTYILVSKQWSLDTYVLVSEQRTLEIYILVREKWSLVTSVLVSEQRSLDMHKLVNEQQSSDTCVLVSEQRSLDTYVLVSFVFHLPRMRGTFSSSSSVHLADTRSLFCSHPEA